MNEPHDIYQPPKADIGKPPSPEELVLAGRDRRFTAALIDGLLSLVVTIPLMYFVGVFDAVAQGRVLGPRETILLAMAGLVIFLLMHGRLLAQHGQTIGKRMLGIRIVDLEGNTPPLGRLIGLRYLPLWVAASIPIIANIVPLVDALFIFRADRRCLHDLVAGTRVVEVR